MRNKLLYLGVVFSIFCLSSVGMKENNQESPNAVPNGVPMTDQNQRMPSTGNTLTEYERQNQKEVLSFLLEKLESVLKDANKEDIAAAAAMPYNPCYEEVRLNGFTDDDVKKYKEDIDDYLKK